jgi:glycerol-3-phosphate acyltransferase PlsX
MPFVGRAGQLLTKIIEACQLSRDEVFILNVLKCRPPDTRPPQPEEVANCRGYCEGYDLFTGGVDVAVCDGFVGNVVLKTSEGLGKTMGALLKSELRANPIRRLGAILALGGLRQIRTRLNPDTYGGAPLLGLQGNVFKIHGSANRFALMNAIRQSARAIHQQLNATIVRELANAGIALASSAPSSP